MRHLLLAAVVTCAFAPAHAQTSGTGAPGSGTPLPPDVKGAVTNIGRAGSASREWQSLITDLKFLGKLQDAVRKELQERNIDPQPGTVLVTRVLVQQNSNNFRSLVSTSYMGSGATSDDAFRDGFANESPDGDLTAPETREYFATTRYLDGQPVTTFGGITPEFRERMLKEGAALREERRIEAKRKQLSDRQRATYPEAAAARARDLARGPPRPGPALKYDPTEQPVGGSTSPPTRGDADAPSPRPAEIPPPPLNAPVPPPGKDPSFQNSVVLPGPT